MFESLYCTADYVNSKQSEIVVEEAAKEVAEVVEDTATEAPAVEEATKEVVEAAKEAPAVEEATKETDAEEKTPAASKEKE